MIEGAVNTAHEAIVSLTLRGPAGQEQEIDAVSRSLACCYSISTA